ncbi:MAG: YopX family protein [Nanoarchaeota archaeon]
MRKNKFRGQLKDDNKWVYGYYVKFLVDLDKNGDPIYEHFIVENIINNRGKRDTYITYHEVKPETVGQYITTNEDGCVIYEDDIVNYLGKKCLVVINPEKGEIAANVITYSDGFLSTWDWDSMKKLGNVHDNPELLEDEK